MLEFLQTGKAVYVLAAVCVLGVISKLVASSFYKSLIRETGNMALTKNKNLKALKQKTENMFLVNRGIRNITAYIDFAGRVGQPFHTGHDPVFPARGNGSLWFLLVSVRFLLYRTLRNPGDFIRLVSGICG